jgi:hypothetical protein
VGDLPDKGLKSKGLTFLPGEAGGVKSSGVEGKRWDDKVIPGLLGSRE